MTRYINEVFRKTEPGSIPPISAAGTDVDGIWLTAIPELVTKHLEDRYELIDSLIGNKSPRDLLNAIDEIIELQSQGGGHEEKLEEYLSKIDNLLKRISKRL